MRAALLVTALALVAACSANVEEADTGRLVVTGADGSVTLIDPAGGDPAVLSDGSGAAVPVQATVSGDGGTVVWSDLSEDGRPVIRVHDESGTREVDVPTLPFYYAFAPDGRRLAALGNDPEGQGVALLLVDLAEDSAELVEVGRPYFVDWAPDGERLAVHIGDAVLGLVDVAGDRTGIQVRPGAFSAPAWTDDGRIVAVVATEQATASAVALQAVTLTLSVVDPDDGSSAVVAPLAEAAAFEVAGERIAYLQGDSGLGPLTVVALDGTDSVEVAGDDVVAFEWSPDGETLLFHTLAESTLVPHVWDGEVVTDYPEFVPTGVFLTQYLPFWAQYTRTVTQWAPDSTAFAYASADQDGDEDEPGTVWVQPLEGGAAEMGPGEMVVWAP